MSEYRDIDEFTGGWVIVETFYSYGESSSNRVRVRPIASEGFAPDVRVQCSTEMRTSHPVGTLFRLFLYPRVAGAKPMLSTRNNTYYEIVDPEESELSAQARIKSEATDEPDTFVERIAWLLERPVFLKDPPTGSTRPEKKRRSATAFQRSPEVAAWIRHNAGGICELCKSKAPFQDRFGFPYLEVHHVVPLSESGEDTLRNTVAVCPNCHRSLHFSENALELTGQLYQEIDRLCKFGGK